MLIKLNTRAQSATYPAEQQTPGVVCWYWASVNFGPIRELWGRDLTLTAAWHVERESDTCTDYRVWVKEVNISEACFKCFCQSHCLNELIADSILVTSSVSTCTTYSGLSWCVNVCRCWKSLKDLRESKWTECYSTRRLPLNLSSWWSTGGPRCSLSSVGFQFCHCALSSVSLMVPPISITNSGFYSLTVAHAKSFFVFLLALQVRGSHSFRPQSTQTSTRACTLHLIST